MRTTTVKICFMVDCTSSMGPFLEAAKREVVETLDELKREHEGAEFQVTFVGYRDYGDKERFITTEWCSPHEMVERILPVEAEGGSDAAEDVATALHKVSRLHWEDADVRLLIHIADSPAHGMQFHSATVSDRFPEGDPDNADVPAILLNLTMRGIDYTFMRITNTTDTMVKAFRGFYIGPGKFNVLRLSQTINDFHRMVSNTVSESVIRHTSSRDPEVE